MTARHAPARRSPSWPFRVVAVGAVVMFAAGTVAALAATVAPRVQGTVRGAVVATPEAGTATPVVVPVSTIATESPVPSRRVRTTAIHVPSTTARPRPTTETRIAITARSTSADLTNQPGISRVPTTVSVETATNAPSSTTRTRRHRTTPTTTTTTTADTTEPTVTLPTLPTVTTSEETP